MVAVTRNLTEIVEGDASCNNVCGVVELAIQTFQEAPPASLETAESVFNDHSSTALSIVVVLLARRSVNIVWIWLH